MAYEEEEPPGAPEWMVTFSDMISLLVTFFVLLLTFSTTSADSQPKLRQFLRGLWGTHDNSGGDPIPSEQRIKTPDRTYSTTGSLERHDRTLEKLERVIDRLGRAPDDTSIPCDILAQVGGLRLTFGPEAAFGPGEWGLPPALARSLESIGLVVADYEVEVVVEGHTDSRFQPTALHPDAEALSLARAASAARALCASGKLAPTRVALAGFGAQRSRSATDDAHARRLDRRVELRLVPVRER